MNLSKTLVCVLLAVNTLGVRETPIVPPVAIVETKVEEKVEIPETLSSESITTPTGLTAEEYELILKGTAIEGQGQTIVDVENEYNINGLFMLSIAKLESGLGAKCPPHNLFGIRGGKGYASYKSYKDGFIAFAKLINKSYTGMSWERLAKKYCPPNWKKWLNMMNGSYNSFRKTIMENR